MCARVVEEISAKFEWKMTKKRQTIKWFVFDEVTKLGLATKHIFRILSQAE